MIRAVFKEWESCVRAYGLTQWDYGQELRIYGLQLPDPIEVHFAPDHVNVALVQIGHTLEDGGTSVEIPDDMLEEGRDITAYVYLCDEKQGETIKTIHLPVKSRQRPEPYNRPNGSRNTIEEILAELAGKADDLTLQEDILQLMSGGKAIGERIRLPIREREIEMHNTGTEIEWRYTDSNEWCSLIILDDIRGPAGESPEFEIRDGHLYAIYQK